jgi:hypothetical protein
MLPGVLHKKRKEPEKETHLMRNRLGACGCFAVDDEERRSATRCEAERAIISCQCAACKPSSLPFDTFPEGGCADSKGTAFFLNAVSRSMQEAAPIVTARRSLSSALAYLLEKPKKTTRL